MAKYYMVASVVMTLEFLTCNSLNKYYIFYTAFNTNFQ